MSLKMGLKLVLLIAMVATNLLSLYHLSYVTNFFKPKKPASPDVPNHLLHQLHALRASITRLTRLHAPPRDGGPVHAPPRAGMAPHAPEGGGTRPHAPAVPGELVAVSRVSAIPTACKDDPERFHRYMNYTRFGLCPDDAHVAETLILGGCHPLPRRRCFTRTPENPRLSVVDSNVIWRHYPSAKCRSFDCLGINLEVTEHEFMAYKSSLDLTIPQLMDIAGKSGSVLRLGVDIGGESGSFAVKMREKNVTVVTTTMNLGIPYSEANAMRGVVAMHAPLQQRLAVYDGVVDLVRCGHAVNRWIPVTMLEFLLYDVDRVLRGGGFLWVDHFFSKKDDFERVYKPLFFGLRYKIVKWATGRKLKVKGAKNGEVYLTALLQKPVSR
ncbi:hypothetical protein vseg_011504 [Gypsophila vaccaria]